MGIVKYTLQRTDKIDEYLHFASVDANFETTTNNE
jgi:hypothetical protein